MRLISNHLRRCRTLSTYATGGQPHTPTARLIAEVSQAPSSENYGTPTHTITSSSESPKLSHLVLSLSRNDTRRWRTKVCFIRALTYIPWGCPGVHIAKTLPGYNNWPTTPTGWTGMTSFETPPIPSRGSVVLSKVTRFWSNVVTPFTGCMRWKNPRTGPPPT